MKSEWLKVIMAANKYRSISVAAQHCNITQPAASRMIVNAENELNTKLFNRFTKANGVELTREGERLLPYLQKALDSLEDLENQALRARHFELSLGMSEDTWGATARSRIIGGFYLCNPDAKLYIQTGINQDLINMLMTDKVDVIIYSVGYNLEEHNIPFGNMPVCIEQLGVRPISVAYNKNEPLPGIKADDTINLKDLKDLKFILHSDIRNKENNPNRRFYFLDACKNAEFEPKFIIVPSNTCDIKQMLVLQNKGIYMSSAPIGLREFPGIAYAKVSDMPYSAIYYAVYKNNHKSAELLELIQFIKSFF